MTAYRILITAGATHEPIDDIRYISNRSSGLMGAAVATACVEGGHFTTIITGPVSVAYPDTAVVHRITTAREMHEKVLHEFPQHDLLIMSAAVADYSPRVASGKLPRLKTGSFMLELFPTPDIVADAVSKKRDDQRAVAFSLEQSIDHGGDDLVRASEKMRYKHVDLMVYNPLATMESKDISPTLLWPGGRVLKIERSEKAAFAKVLLSHAVALFE